MSCQVNVEIMAIFSNIVNADMLQSINQSINHQLYFHNHTYIHTDYNNKNKQIMEGQSKSQQRLPLEEHHIFGAPHLRQLLH